MKACKIHFCASRQLGSDFGELSIGGDLVIGLAESQRCLIGGFLAVESGPRGCSLTELWRLDFRN